MKILIDIGHPAHVHYFKNFIKIMNKKGHETLVVARNRDCIFELLKFENIQMLRKKNILENYNIYITPFSKENDFYLIDDVKDVSKLKEKYTPALVLESSKENWQCVLKVKKDKIIEVCKEAKNKFFRQILGGHITAFNQTRMELKQAI